MASEYACLALLCAWLFWLPLPFGSNIVAARLPLVAVPLFCCAVACALRLRGRPDATDGLSLPRPWKLWTGGSLLFLLVGVLQLVPLPAPLHRAIAPQSLTLWSAAQHLADLAGLNAQGAAPLTLDPAATRFEVLRVAAMIAAFVTASLLVRTQPRRLAIAFTLIGGAAFESLYGVREAALQRYAIWGWPNRLVHNRVTGTFVNPNHFAHYLAIVLPMALFLVAVAWRNAGREPMPLARRIMRMLEHHPWLTGIGLLGTLTALLGMMLAQSRGALLALFGGLAILLAMIPGKRVVRVAAGGTAAIVVVIALVLFLGFERTVERFTPTEAERGTLGGRATAIATAVRLWQRFPVSGTGWGTFEQAASLEQNTDLAYIYNHAHNDYAEIAATSGTIGLVVAIVTLFGGLVALARRTFGAAANDLAWRRRAWQAAAIASLLIAMVHALFDFNFFIPANPATLAVILGAAVASVDYDRRMRR